MLSIQKNPDYQLAAYHEAGHAVVSVLFGRLVQDVMIDARRPGYGLVRFAPRSHSSFDDGSPRLHLARLLIEIEKMVMVLLAGPVAEAKLLRTPLRSLGAHSDFENVEALLACLDRLRHGPDRCASHVPESVEQLSHRLRIKTKRLIARAPIWRAITVLAHDLMDWRQLTGEDVTQTVRWTINPKTQLDLFASI